MHLHVLKIAYLLCSLVFITILFVIICFDNTEKVTQNGLLYLRSGGEKLTCPVPFSTSQKFMDLGFDIQWSYQCRISCAIMFRGQKKGVRIILWN